ncbi:MAG: ketopantoate reductase family protein [Methanobacteriota archaeon]
MTKLPKVAVVGAGAIGGTVAACAAAAGEDVTLFVRDEAAASRLRKDGLRVTGARAAVARPPVATLGSGNGSRFDMVFLATKLPQLAETVRAFAPRLSDHGFFVTLQNGLPEESVAAASPAHAPVGAVVEFGATNAGDGAIEVTSRGRFVVGELRGPVTPRVHAAAGVLSRAFPTKATHNLAGHRWAKLITNSCISTLGGVSGTTLGECLDDPRARNVFLSIVTEGVETAGRHGVLLERVGGRLSLPSLSLADERQRKGLRFLKKHLVLRVVGRSYRRVRTSMLQDLERGRRTEIDWLNGEISGVARRYGVPTPTNDALVALVKKIEAGKRVPSPALFAEVPSLA